MSSLKDTISKIGLSPSAVTRELIISQGGSGMLSYYTSLRGLLQKFYGQLPPFSRYKAKKNQQLLQVLVKDVAERMLKTTDIWCDYKHPDLISKKTSCILPILPL
jgi:hypothetical protein